MNDSHKPILIGLAGGTGSGKTLVAKTLVKRLGSDRVVIVEQDSYYRANWDLPFEERAKVNYDHPDAFDHELLVEHMDKLMLGESIEMPVYDYSQHTRSKVDTVRIENHVVIILEGILVLHDPLLREKMDIKVFVDTDNDVRFIRRLRRDVKERGRSLDNVIDQYENVVRPMHLQFVEPSKRSADIILPQGGKNLVAIDLLQTKIASLLLNFY
jgi:uridine kinase